MPFTPPNNRVLRNKNKSNHSEIINNAAVGQLQHLRLTDKLDSLNLLN